MNLDSLACDMVLVYSILWLCPGKLILVDNFPIAWQLLMADHVQLTIFDFDLLHA